MQCSCHGSLGQRLCWTSKPPPPSLLYFYLKIWIWFSESNLVSRSRGSDVGGSCSSSWCQVRSSLRNKTYSRSQTLLGLKNFRGLAVLRITYHPTPPRCSNRITCFCLVLEPLEDYSKCKINWAQFNRVNYTILTICSHFFRLISSVASHVFFNVYSRSRCQVEAVHSGNGSTPFSS